MRLSDHRGAHFFFRIRLALLKAFHSAFFAGAVGTSSPLGHYLRGHGPHSPPPIPSMRHGSTNSGRAFASAEVDVRSALISGGLLANVETTGAGA